ncbi:MULTISPECIES: MafI family immunity protein [unclassified Microbacterium]|uniref:MafI family immunity protein n=1 Tax=unclassified Microbacterium TaxID=2609290 RepID=UPI00109C0D0A|nr:MULTISPECIES: MafI family immunity protein [unclassified Microbacterium]
MTTELSPEQAKALLRQALRATPGLPAEDYENVQSLIDVGETLVAFETLCTQIHEWEISLRPETIRGLEVIGSALGGDAALTNHLWEDSTE